MTKWEIEKIQKKYPKFCKTAASLAARPEETGVILIEDVLNYVSDGFPDEWRIDLTTKKKTAVKPAVKPRKRTKPNRMEVRLSDWDIEAVKVQQRILGMNNQEYLEMLIRRDVYGED